jgi:F420-non-reducing hydrogenase iron-sulfur subunit
MKSAPNVRIVRLMCSGRVDPSFILRAFQLGADGVLVGGCHPGDCHYQEGNFKALRRVLLLRRVLRDFGIDERRLRLEWISAAEGEKFAKVSTEFTEEVRALGPLRLETGVLHQSPTEELAKQEVAA